VAVSLLGPLRVDGNGQLSPRDRVVLSALAIRSGDVLSPEQLADALWGEAPPASWPKVVQGCVLRLRQSLGRDAVQTTSGGYRLTLGDDEIDVRRFERLVERGRRLVAGGEPDRAAAGLAEALSLWRGRPLADLDRWPAGQAEAARLEELRQAAEETLVEARLASGADTVADATALVAAGPVREHRWWLLAVSLYRAGRQTDALAALRRARRTLQEELGLDPGEELVALEHAILTHDPALAGPVPAPRPASDVCPYKGLVVYDRGDAEWFFGRDEEVAACLHALRASPLLVVAGPSGCGKSSLVRAGVVPALEAARHTATVLTPGSDPAAALTAALTGTRRDAVVVVDQLEELFTAGHDPSVVTDFLDRLVGLASAGVSVVAVVRADQLGGLSSSAAMARAVERGLHLVAPMSEDDLRQAVEGPAHRAGLRLEPGLADLLLREVEGEAGALPLLSHALAETWAQREGAVLTVDGYRATGGIRGAVAQTAEQLWESLTPPQRTSARSLLLRMVALSAEGEPAAARVPLSVAAPDAERARLVELLARCRLVTTDDRSVTVAHEAVVRAWPRLRSWLDDDAAGQRMLRHLSVAAEDWAGRGRPDSELYRGARLVATAEWRERARPELTAVETDFLVASVAFGRAEQAAAHERVRAQARQNRRLRVALVGTVLGLVVALVAGLVAVQQSRDQARTARAALVDELVAQSVALRSTQRDLAALLAVEAYRLSPQASTRGALFGVFTATPGFEGYLRTPVPASSGALLADGRTLLAAGVDGVVRVVDLRRGPTGERFPRPQGKPVRALVAVSTDESTVAEVSWERGQGDDDESGQSTLGVYDAANRTRLAPDVVVPMDVGAVAVSPDGRYVAVSGYDDGRVLVFDTRTGSPLPELGSVDDERAGVVRLPPAGPAARLAALDRYRDGRDADYTGWGVRYTAALAFQPDGRLVVGSEVGSLRVVDPSSGRVLQQLTGAPPLTSNNRLVMSPDASVLVSTGSRGVVRWNLRTGRPAWVADVSEDRCGSVALLRQQERVLCGGRYGKVESLHVADGRSIPAQLNLQHGRVSGLLVTPDGTALVELSESEPVVGAWALDGTGPVMRRLPVPWGPVGYDASGGLLLTSGPDEVDRTYGPYPALRIVNARSGAMVRRLRGYEEAWWSARPGVLVAWDDFGTGYLVDARTGRRKLTLQGGFGGETDGLSAAAGGRVLFAWSDDSGLAGRPVWEAWDLRTGESLRSGFFTGTEQLGGSLTSRGDVAVWSGANAVRSLRVGDGQVMASREGVGAAAVSPTGVVAASTADGRLAFLDASSLRADGPPLPGSPGLMRALGFSRDGRLLAAHGGDDLLRLVDVEARTQLGEPIQVTGGDPRSALRPDGRELVVTAEGSLAFWDLRPSRWQAAACRLVGRNLTRQEWDTYLSAAGEYRRTCPA
jgi:DNA-binding SARP family transcriptional activator/WD40 repeat protein